MHTALLVLMAIWLAGYAITLPLIGLALWFRREFPQGEHRHWVLASTWIMLFCLGSLGGVGLAIFFVLDWIFCYPVRRRKAIEESVMCKVRDLIADLKTQDSTVITTSRVSDTVTKPNTR